ncbi:MAG: hypothetical protein IJT94_11225 [Oscillibacter sp.]|nr:hypothetical protein [Oscillibacter sp.]
MADRRMFCKSVVESDQFMCMPADAQALYLHLNMAADDDGFVANPRTIMRACGSSDDSMKLLIARKFVLTFEKQDNFVVVIKHWRLNNYIRKDTYRETRYKEFMRDLYFDENQSYSTNPGDGHYPCIPETSPAPVTAPSRTRHAPVTAPSRDSNAPLTQDRIGKDRGRIEEGKVSTGKDNTIPSTSTERQEEEGEYEGEQPPPAASVVLSPEERKERIEYHRFRVSCFSKRGWHVPDMIYDEAAAEGITREEIDGP